MAWTPTVAPRTLRVMVPGMMALGVVVNGWSLLRADFSVSSGREGLAQVGLFGVWWVAGLFCTAPFRREIGIEIATALAAPVGALVWTVLVLALYASDLTPSLAFILPVHGLLVAASVSAMRKQGPWTRREVVWPCAAGGVLLSVAFLASLTLGAKVPLAADSAFQTASVPWDALGARGAFVWVVTSGTSLGSTGVSGATLGLSASGLLALWLFGVRGLRLLGADLRRARWVSAGAVGVMATSPGWIVDGANIGGDVVMGGYVLTLLAGGWFGSVEDEPVWWLWSLVAALGLTLMGTMTPVLVGLAGGILLARAPLVMSQRIAWMAAYLLLSMGWYGWWVAHAEATFSPEKAVLLFAVPAVMLGLFGTPGPVVRWAREHLAMVSIVVSVVMVAALSRSIELDAAGVALWSGAVGLGLAAWVIGILAPPVRFELEIRAGATTWIVVAWWLSASEWFPSPRSPWVQVLPVALWLAALLGLGRTPDLQVPPKPKELLEV